MEQNQILETITILFKKILNNQQLTLTPEMNASHIDNWDSITNIQLMVAIENFFKIRFSASEIQHFKNIEEIILAIQKKTV